MSTSTARWLFALGAVAITLGAVAIIGAVAIVIWGGKPPERPSPVQKSLPTPTFNFDPVLTPTPTRNLLSMKSVIETGLRNDVGGQIECISRERYEIEVVYCHVYFEDTGQIIILLGQYDLWDYSTQRSLSFTYIPINTNAGTVITCGQIGTAPKECGEDYPVPQGELTPYVEQISRKWIDEMGQWR